MTRKYSKVLTQEPIGYRIKLELDCGHIEYRGNRKEPYARIICHTCYPIKREGPSEAWMARKHRREIRMGHSRRAYSKMVRRGSTYRLG